MAKVKFTRRILEDLEEAAHYFKKGNDIIDKAVRRELKCKRNEDRRKNVKLNN